MSDHLYAIYEGHVISVHRNSVMESRIFSLKGGDTTYELRIDGNTVDKHEHATIPKKGVLFGTIKHGDKNVSVRVDISPWRVKINYDLQVDGVTRALAKSTEIEIKSLIHNIGLHRP